MPGRPNDTTMFDVVDEPDISILPDSAVLPLTGFHLPEGHPDRPREEE